MIPEPHDKNFPIVFENDNLVVYHNTAGEIFVALKKYNVQIRVGGHDDGLQITAHDNLLLPGAVNGLPCINVRGDRFNVKTPQRPATKSESNNEDAPQTMKSFGLDQVHF